MSISRALVRATRVLSNLQTPPARCVTTRRRTATTSTSTTATTTSTDPTPSMLRFRPLEHDSLPRYPTTSALGLLRLSDYIGTASFAYSGSLLAAASGMDILGSTMVGTITAVGGGTIRDAIILRKPPFWTEETEYLYITFITGAATFLAYASTTPGTDREDSLLEHATDTLGVGAFSVIGAINGVRARVPGLVCGICGMATATFGGVVRDILCKRDVRILHSRAEIYASTAAAGASTYLLASRLGAGVGTRVATGVGTAIALRAWASTKGIRLPVWEPKQESRS